MLNSLHITNIIATFAERIGGLSTPADKGNPTALPLCSFVGII